MLFIQNLIHYYGTKKIIDIPFLEIKKGEQWILTGASGSGKTTLLHLVAGLIEPSQKADKINVIGQEIQNLKGSKLDKFRAKNIGLIFQKAHLVNTLNVLQNLLLVPFLAGEKQDKNLCKSILEKVGMKGFENYFPHQLSIGQAHRVAVARAILLNPSLILADEPTAGLDDENAQQVINLLKLQTQENNTTLIIATHEARIKENFNLSFHLK
jgi:putative ABC transport system ATP-binding protein